MTYKQNAGSHRASFQVLLRSTICYASQFIILLLVTQHCCFAQSLEERLKAEQATELAAEARQHGDPNRGAAVFFARAMACATCHSVGDRVGSIGPDLTKLDPQTSDASLVEAILEPSKTIAPAYATITIATVDGRLISGLLVEESTEQITLRDATQLDRTLTLRKQDIEDRQATKQSIMPAGQVNQLRDRQQFLDLVRYLIEVRDGGAQRARALQPPADPFAQKVPDYPQPWQPVVQRGLITVEGNLRYPQGLALGFTGGTLLFDAQQLAPVAVWHGGFVKSIPQNYFGLDWMRDGGSAERLTTTAHPLRFQLPGQDIWQSFEMASTSDPNTGTRFDGYQIGHAAVRLHYRVLVARHRVRVTEDIHVESRPEWQGVVRAYSFTGLPVGARVALAIPTEGNPQYLNIDSKKIETSRSPKQAPLLKHKQKETTRVVLGQADGDATWLTVTEQGAAQSLITSLATEGKPVHLRLDSWKYVGRRAEPSTAELASLVSNAFLLDDAFDSPRKPTSLPPIARVSERAKPVVNRPAVHPQENVDEFPATRARFLRFVVTRTIDQSEPGIDELEVYGADPKLNLAIKGKATASSVIKGYAIHQIPHVNDGRLGNPHSWISGEKGGGWVQIEFPEAVSVNKIVWARDRTGASRDRLASAYRIEVSTDGLEWKIVGDETGRAATENAIGAIRRDAAPGYVMESIPLPFPSCRPADIAFGDDGVLYAIALTEGQIWRTRLPPVGHPEQVEWQRYASGLHHALGLATIEGRLFVSQKPEITELIDRNSDGVVDHYRTFATGWGLSSGWHEYCFGLALDPQRNLWFGLNTGHFWTHPDAAFPGRWRGSILRVGLENEKLEQMATGCRVPNGISQGPEGSMFFTDNQGDWIQVCKLAHIVPGRFYGHPETKENTLPKGSYPEGRSAVWLPYARSRSTSGPVCDLTNGYFGRFPNQIFVGDVGYGANAGIMRVALEKVNGEYQGACFRFIDGQPLGCERMKFGPDNQLYSASLSSGLTRVAYNGNLPLAIQSVQIRPRGQGFTVHFTKPLAENTNLDPAQFAVKQYHYLYTGNYGSPIADEKPIRVIQAELSMDRKTLTLSLPVETYPIGMVYEMNLGKLTSADGEHLVQNEAWYTVHAIPE
jgi:putative heme-binding domain-containing protein